jgi:hypothetical protein
MITNKQTNKVTSHIIYHSLPQKVLFATKEDLIKRMASDDHFWTCGEVAARAAPYGPGTVTIQGILLTPNAEAYHSPLEAKSKFRIDH